MTEGHWVSIEVVAECFAVRASILEEACEYGIVHAVRRDETLVVSTSELDLVARIVRMHVHQGVDLAGIALVLAK